MNRQDLFAKLARATPAQPEPYPDYTSEELLSRTGRPAEIAAAFLTQFGIVNGKAFTTPEALATFLTNSAATRGYCDPALFALLGQPLTAAGLHVAQVYDRDRYDDYQFGITRATGAIAETGTLVLTDEVTSDRLAALTPWIHIAVLAPADIAPSVPAAIERFGRSVNIIWATGPSRTADVEGILIEGVHGPGVQGAYLLSESTSWTDPASSSSSSSSPD